MHFYALLCKRRNNGSMLDVRVTDKFDRGDLGMMHAHKDKMWSSMLTNPKQDKAFRMCRAELMNVIEDCDDNVEQIYTNLNLLPKPEQYAKARTTSAMTLTKAVIDKLSDKQKRNLQAVGKQMRNNHEVSRLVIAALT